MIVVPWGLVTPYTSGLGDNYVSCLKKHNFGLAVFWNWKSDNWCEDNSIHTKCWQILIAFLSHEHTRVLSVPCEGFTKAWSHDVIQGRWWLQLKHGHMTWFKGCDVKAWSHDMIQGMRLVAFKAWSHDMIQGMRLVAFKAWSHDMIQGMRLVAFEAWSHDMIQGMWLVDVHVIYLYEVRVHPVCEGFLLDSLIFTCRGWREGGGEKGKGRGEGEGERRIGGEGKEREREEEEGGRREGRV